MHHIARCCQPIPGDDIVGLITQGRGISISPLRLRSACRAAIACAGTYRGSRLGRELLGGLLRWWCASLPTTAAACCATSPPCLANEKVNVLGVASRSDTREQLATIDMTIEIYNLQVLGRVLGKLNQVPDVIDARRLHGG